MKVMLNVEIPKNTFTYLMEGFLKISDYLTNMNTKPKYILFRTLVPNLCFILLTKIPMRLI